MSSSEPPSLQTSDVESLLRQMKLREPSDRLDSAIASLVTADEVREYSVSPRLKFGWTAILSAVVAAMVAGVWLGGLFSDIGEKQPVSGLATVVSDSGDAGLLTPVSFNVDAFNLLHGHSQQSDFENCGQCHKTADVQGNELDGIFQSWFYGNEHFFEVHPDGIDDCSKCHVAAVGQNGIPRESHSEFAKLVRCSDCHRVDASGFGGFKTDWRLNRISSEG